MPSSTLYREGDDLDTLLADLDDEWPGCVRVVSIEQVRSGGVRGLFGRPRVGVHFQIDDEDGRATPAAPTDEADLLAGLIALADAEETPKPARVEAEAAIPAATTGASTSGDRVEATLSATAAAALGVDVPASSNAEFAAMLMAMAQAKSAQAQPSHAQSAQAQAQAQATPPPAPVATPPRASTPVRQAVPDRVPDRVPDVLPERPDADPRLALRRRLTEIGVPVDWIPQAAPDARAAVRQITSRLPMAPAAPTAPGQILAIVGPLAAGVRAAEAVRASLGLESRWVWVAARDGAEPLADSAVVISSPWRAAAVARCHRMASSSPAIVVIATEDDLPSDAAVGELLAAVQPDAVWRVVDATRKPADSRQLVQQAAPDALVVTGACVSSSPATVWQSGHPVATVDGKPATATTWEAVLLSALAAQEA